MLNREELEEKISELEDFYEDYQDLLEEMVDIRFKMLDLITGIECLDDARIIQPTMEMFKQFQHDPLKNFLEDMSMNVGSSQIATAFEEQLEKWQKQLKELDD